MYTEYTYQDWQAMGASPESARKIIESYKTSAFFVDALNANRYFAGENPTLSGKYLLRIETRERKDPETGMTIRSAERKEVAGNRVSSAFLRRFVCQQNQFLLGNGVTLKDAGMKKRLGRAFDVLLQQIGEKALLHGVSYGYWNLDHIEAIPAVSDANSGCVGLLDEITGGIGAAIQFWQLSTDRPLYMRIFEPDGVTMYKYFEGVYTQEQPKRPYTLAVRADALGVVVVGGENYNGLPIVPLYANDEHTSELTPSIKAKIDLYDKITSDFGDNLDRANDVYWVLTNFGGSVDNALQVVQEIQELKIAMNVNNGVTSSNAQPYTIEVPYTARQTALDLLEKALYQDAMALSMNELTGGSLTNVAIQAAMTNLNLKCDHYEWQCFAFVQQILHLMGIDTEEISFQRQQIVNQSETVQDIYTMRSDIDRETALKLNPYISQDDIPAIMEALDAEEVTGMPNMDALQKAIEARETGGDDEAGN